MSEFLASLTCIIIPVAIIAALVGVGTYLAYHLKVPCNPPHCYEIPPDDPLWDKLPPRRQAGETTEGYVARMQEHYRDKPSSAIRARAQRTQLDAPGHHPSEG